MQAVSQRTQGALFVALVTLGLVGGRCFVPVARPGAASADALVAPHANGMVATPAPALRGAGRPAPTIAGLGETAAALAALAGAAGAVAAAGRRLATRRSPALGRARLPLVVMSAEGSGNGATAIEKAAAKLSTAAYPFMQQVPWNSDEFLLSPGKTDPIGWAKAIGKIIDMGASMDSGYVKAGCQAHHAAIVDLPANGVCSEAQLATILACIGRMVASVPESKTMAVYDAVSALVDAKVPNYLMSKVKEADAKAAHEALLEFTTVVKANPITPTTPATALSSSDASAIDAAATALASVAYPFMEGVDWTDSLYAKPPPGKPAQEVLKAVDSMIVMGAQMDSAALKEAALAHVGAIERMDSKGVLTQKDFEAVLAGLGKAIGSVPASTVMGVYSHMSGLAGVGSEIPAYLYAKQNPADAMAAYRGLMRFKNQVQAKQPASYDPFGEAAAKLSKATYPFMQQVPWNSDEFLLSPGKTDPIGWAKAIGKIIDMGASMDGGCVKAGCQAHHAAIANLPANGVCSEAQLATIYACIGRMVASVPESKTMAVYDAVSALVDAKVPNYLMSKVKEADAKAAYEALLEFTTVVKANPITPSTPATTLSSSAASSIDGAATVLASAAYPFMEGVDWTDSLYAKPPPGKSAQEVLKAVDSMIVMGAEMDWAALKEAALAHVGAIERMDSKGVLTQDDFKAVLAGLGKAIGSVPASIVMGVYNQMRLLAGEGSGIPAYLYEKQNPANAMAAYSALMGFKDTVRGAQPSDDGGVNGQALFAFFFLFAATVLPNFGGSP